MIGSLRFPYRSWLLSRILILFPLLSITAAAQTPESRITQPIWELITVRLTGHVHPLAKAQYDQGAVSDEKPINHILLQLSRTDAQEAALNKLLKEQQTPGSANYHSWLTPQEFGNRFGASDEDIQKITAWLTSKGFTVNRVSAAKNLIDFSGTAGQLRSAFHTELHNFTLGNATFTANNADPEVPMALAPVVSGFVSLNNFPRQSYAHVRGTMKRAADGKVRPQWTTKDGYGDTIYPLGPGDFATIYSSKSLLDAGIDGTGQTIGIVGQSNIYLSDVSNFRKLFGLSNSTPTVTIADGGTDPGVDTRYEGEALLDVQWAGAVAPGASIDLVISQSTDSTSGVDLAAEHIIDNNSADILSESWGACEPQLLSSGNRFYYSLWQQAAAQGITVVVSSGDSGSAGCESGNAPVSADALGGLAVSGIASTPYNVAVGGTDFNNANSLSTYWNSTNGTDSSTGQTRISAKSYIPEMTWNDSCAYSATSSSLNVCSNKTVSDYGVYGGLQLWAGGGGASNCSSSTEDSNGNINCNSGYSKPSWQSATGVPKDGVRDVPDVSFFAATGSSGSNSMYTVCQADQGGDCNSNDTYPSFVGMGGTSASAPNFAGVVALAGQKLGGTRLGNINYLLYKLAGMSNASCTSSASASSSCIYYDLQQGNISVPCAPGSQDCSATSGSNPGVLVSNSSPAFMTSSGYDLATGLGSVNITNLVAAIANNAVPTISNPTANPNPAKVNSSTTLSVTVTGSSSIGTPSGTITFYDGNSSLGTASTTSNSSAHTLTGTLSYAFNTTGEHSIKATYSGDNYYISKTSNTLSLDVNTSASISTPTATSTSFTLGNSTTLSTTVTGSSSTGVPTGTITFYDGSTSIGTASTSSDSSNYTLSGTLSYTPTSSGTRKITAKYSGDDNYASVTSSALSLQVNAAFSMSLASTSITASSSGGSGSNTVTFTSSSTGYKGTVTYSCSSTSSDASCSPTSSSAGSVVLDNNSGTGSVTYTVPALSSSAAPMQHNTPWKLGGGVLLGGVFLFAVPGARKRTQLALMMLLMAVAILASCGGSSSKKSKTYTFTVTASATDSGQTTTQTSTFTVTN
jgi:hypothetical protein